MARPRTFDADAALDAALRVFWSRGYRGASLEELTGVSGGSRPSLYAAFGDKEGLFLAALERYEAQFVAPALAALEDEPDGRAAVRAFLVASAERFTDPDRPPGCLIAAHAAGLEEEPGASDEAPQRAIAAADARLHGRLRDRLIRAKADGNLPAGEPPGPLADLYHGVRHALSTQARLGRSERALRATIDAALRGWPTPPH
ncbi:TetR/AcrR family transcriptional regulator [Alienimonas californiensis]|uniref:HTH-type transcriptional repressor ComR n=1 Tax=Alienimonas californiensis TaxID=2527989 RepID=A0A517PAE7_9PLAN|nr:TetR/AcrR family transcriptional regulator [Alienimonas californiensis]QDT16350.1 HTH-type transcriptional repressor ComR [Alienimonas californiensis]